MFVRKKVTLSCVSAQEEEARERRERAEGARARSFSFLLRDAMEDDE
jgi:hypothetical protein